MWLPALNSKFFVNKKMSNVSQKKTHCVWPFYLTFAIIIMFIPSV